MPRKKKPAAGDPGGPDNPASNGNPQPGGAADQPAKQGNTASGNTPPDALAAPASVPDSPKRGKTPRTPRKAKQGGSKTERAPLGKRGGRPATFNDELFETILSRMYEPRVRSLAQVCKDDDIPVTDKAVYYWIRESQSLFYRYMRAREIQAEKLGWEGLALCDLALEGGQIHELLRHLPPDASVGSMLNALVTRARLQFDARKWLAAVLSPHTHGKDVTVQAPEADAETLEGVAEQVDKAASAEDAAKIYAQAVGA